MLATAKTFLMRIWFLLNVQTWEEFLWQHWTVYASCLPSVFVGRFWSVWSCRFSRAGRPEGKIFRNAWIILSIVSLFLVTNVSVHLLGDMSADVCLFAYRTHANTLSAPTRSASLCLPLLWKPSINIRGNPQWVVYHSFILRAHTRQTRLLRVVQSFTMSDSLCMTCVCVSRLSCAWL